MKKEISYLFEYLCKNEKPEEAQLYASIAHALEKRLLYVPSQYTQEKLTILMRHMGYAVPTNYEEAIKRFDALIEAFLPKPLFEAKKTLFMSLLSSNFPKKKGFLEHSFALFESQLEPVEKSIYHNLSAYVKSINRGLGLFFIFGEKSTPEMLIAFTNDLHVNLLQKIYNEEEKTLLQQGLSELMAVFIGLYGKYLFEKEPA